MGFYRCIPVNSQSGGDIAEYMPSINGNPAMYAIAAVNVSNQTTMNRQDVNILIPAKCRILQNLVTSLGSFNGNITFEERGDNRINLTDFVRSCNSFNSAVNFPENVSCFSTSGMISYSRSFNSPIRLGNHLVTVGVVIGCNNFNSEITIPDGNQTWYRTYLYSETGTSYQVQNVIKDCPNYNRPIVIPNNYARYDYLIANCINFNQNVDFRGFDDKIYSLTLGWILWNCTNFNARLSFPTSYVNVNCNAYSLLTNCYKFNRDIIMPNVANINVGNALRNCTSFGSNIYFKGNVLYAANLLTGTNNSLRKNIWCKDATNFIKDVPNGIYNVNIIWSTMSHGYYNSVVNTYIYNNYNP